MSQMGPNRQRLKHLQCPSWQSKDRDAGANFHGRSEGREHVVTDMHEGFYSSLTRVWRNTKCAGSLTGESLLPKRKTTFGRQVGAKKGKF